MSPLRRVLLGLLAGPLLVLGAGLGAATVACNTSPWGGEELRDPERNSAEHAWKLTREAAPQVPRYAFFPQAGRTYTELSARAFHPGTAYENAQPNERSQLASLFDDTEFALYVTELGQRVSGEQWQARRAESNPSYTFSRRGEPKPRKRNEAAAETFAPAKSEREAAGALPRPSRLVGTLLMFANREEAMAVAVMEDPRDSHTRWYLAIEGRRGDRAYYRLGDTARVYLQVATRDLSRAMGR